MTQRQRAITRTAGERFVAYCLARRGFLPALTRGGSPSVDIIVTTQDGSNAAAIQVKTSSRAKREYKHKKATNYWLWDVGPRVFARKAKNLLYAFVDLREGTPDGQYPVVFIVPSEQVCGQVKPDDKRYMFWIEEGQESEYMERWDRIAPLLEVPVR